MSDQRLSDRADLKLPRRQLFEGQTSIPAPSHEAFRSYVGDALPTPVYLDSDLGSTAVYDLQPPSGTSRRNVLIVHGINTPAFGLLPFAKELQALDLNTHIVLYDLWGHGLTSTPLVAHAPSIFHQQMFQVLGYKQWTKAHIIGYSFGASTAITFSLANPWIPESVTLLGPAGLLQWSDFDEKLQALLQDSGDREAAAIDCVFDWLGASSFTLPSDWKQRLNEGPLIADVMRDWALKEHAGYRHSVLSMFRDGGVYGRDEKFRAFAQLPFRKFGVVGETDPVCNKKQLVNLGFEEVEVVAKEGHDFPRTKAAETARFVSDFWSRQGLSSGMNSLELR